MTVKDCWRLQDGGQSLGTNEPCSTGTAQASYQDCVRAVTQLVAEVKPTKVDECKTGLVDSDTCRSWMSYGSGGQTPQGCAAKTSRTCSSNCNWSPVFRTSAANNNGDYSIVCTCPYYSCYHYSTNCTGHGKPFAVPPAAAEYVTESARAHSYFSS